MAPNDSGPSKPSGSVNFLDNGNAISGCTARPLTVSPSGSTATCTASHATDGTYSITADYGGDTDFAVSSTASAQTETVTAPVPHGTSAPPAPSGEPKQGQTLTAANGQWNPTPTSYAYQWEDCDGQGTDCVAITGATDSSYVLRSSDVGHTLVVLVTARNQHSSSSPAASAPTAVIAPVTGPAPPVTVTGRRRRRP